MFSDVNEGFEKDLIQKASNNEYSDPSKKEGIFGEIWSNQNKKIYCYCNYFNICINNSHRYNCSCCFKRLKKDNCFPKQ